MAVYFTADSHFNSNRTLEHSKRPFSSVEEMDRILINNWNSIITNDDIVFHLGDFGDFKTAKQLNGQIILVPGNHERLNPDFINYNSCFTGITQDITTLDYKGYHITMAHEPSLIKDNLIDETNINIFGHLHKLCMIKPFGINVGIDCHNYKPIDFDTILFYHNQLLTYYDNEVLY